MTPDVTRAGYDGFADAPLSGLTCMGDIGEGLRTAGYGRPKVVKKIRSSVIRSAPVPEPAKDEIEG